MMPGENAAERMANAGVSGYAYVVLAASLWATLGLIFTALARLGLQPLTVATARAALGGGLLLIGLLVMRPGVLRLNRKALAVTVLYGVIGIALFYVAYVNAVATAGMAVGAVLLYTAPAWVALIAWRFLGEKLTPKHLMALLLALVGVALIAGVYPSARLSVNGPGVFWGLLAGLSYAFYSVLNKIGVRYTNPWALQCYGLLIGAVTLIGLQPPGRTLAAVDSAPAIFWLFVLAAGPTIGAAVSYAMAVQRLPVSVTSVVATLEPVLAVALAAIFLHERLNFVQVAGGAMIVTAALMLQPRSLNQSFDDR